MYKKIITILLICVTLICSGFKPVGWYIKRAGKNIDRGDFKEAKKNYLKALEIEKDNYKANLGMGFLLSETLEDYATALPYLEKALKNQNKDTVADLSYALGKSYQFTAQFAKALFYFTKLNQVKAFEDDNLDFIKDVTKRKLDCQYALQNFDKIKSTFNSDCYVVNVGKTINTDAPEYVPVFNLQNQLIFTSKRKDEKQKITNILDIKYYESMFISKLENGKFSDAKPYELSELKSNYLRGNESVISITGDGKELFVFKNGKIYETSFDELKKTEAKLLNKSINEDYYQSHAFLTKDGTTLYFTSDSKNGLGGNDIYKSTKISDGEWTPPENLGGTINTGYDEDAPFMSEDGKTLYFSSKGHLGYGNYDIFKSTFENGKWSQPENLGQPVNSTGNDIFLIQTQNQSTGYFSSSRIGGFGGMDIYKVNYFNTIDKTCPANLSTLTTLKISDTELEDFKNTIDLNLQQPYKALSYDWQINGKIIGNNRAVLSYDYLSAGIYTISVKTIAYCDSCLEPIVACNIIENKFETKIVDTVKTLVSVDLKIFKGELNNEQLKFLGFNINPILFDLKQNTLNTEAETILQTNSAVLKQYPSLSIQLIVGYSKINDNKKISNLSLSKARAQSVKNYLLKKKVLKKQIQNIITKSDADVKTITSSDQQPQQSRRVIIKVFNTIKK